MINKKIIFSIAFFISALTGSSQNFFSDENIIFYTDIVVPASVCAGDLNGDGNESVLATYYHEIYLHDNMDGLGNFSAGETIITLDGESTFILLEDLDGDGDLDILVSMVNPDKIVWFENLDGLGNFGPQRLVTTEVDRPWSLATSDLNGNGFPDIISTSVFDQKIAWYENTDGKGNFGPQQIILSSVPWPNSVHTADINNNGYQDILFVSGSYNDSKVNWIKNTDGQGNFDSPQVITTQARGAVFVTTADLNGNGYQDVLSASVFDDKIAWYENLDGEGNFGPQNVISTNADGASYVYAADLEGNGYLDVLSASANDDKIALYKNLDGNGTFGPEQIIATNAWEAGFIHVSDLDNDGLPDIISASYDFKIAWYKNTLPMKILANPSDIAILPYENAEMTIRADFANSYQWQVNTGDGYTDLSDGTIYNGTSTDTLQINGAPFDMTGFLYRCVVSNSSARLFSDAAVLTVRDTIPPVIVLFPENQVVQADSSCMAIIPDYRAYIVATDNSSGELYISQSPMPWINTLAGPDNIVLLTVADESGNSAEVSFNVSVVDQTPPVIISEHKDIGLEPNAFGQVYLPDFRNSLIAYDNCTRQSDLLITQTPAPFTDIGGTSLKTDVTLSVTDNAGNSSSVTFSANVIDNVNPIVICVANQTRYVPSGQMVYYTSGNEFDPVSVYDNVGVASVRNNLFNSSTLDGAPILLGTTKVIWTVRDLAGNQSQCSFDVTVTVSTDVDPAQETRISVYPIPTKGTLHIEIPGQQILSVRIMDVIGNTLLEKKNLPENPSLDLSGLVGGIFFCTITTEKEVFTIKILKE